MLHTKHCTPFASAASTRFLPWRSSLLGSSLIVCARVRPMRRTGHARDAYTYRVVEVSDAEHAPATTERLVQVRWDCEVCPHYFRAELREALGWGRLRVSRQGADAVRVGVL